MSVFQLRIVEQGWMPGPNPEYDLCSHGSIELLMDGHRITSKERYYGVSTSALQLLRTLRADRARDDSSRDRILRHGCGELTWGGCGIGVDWTTRHGGGRVHLSNVARFESAGGANPIEFPEIALDLDFRDYAEAVVMFARTARALFETALKHPKEAEFEPGEFAAFWREYDALLGEFSEGTLRPLAV